MIRVVRDIMGVLVLSALLPHQSAASEKAIFAGGCFWCMESPFEKVKGVEKVISGYSGGTKVSPTYEEVSSKSTGHAEVVEIHFDPKVIGYDKLLDIFWRQIDPTDADGQFVDRGSPYRPGIFYLSDEQKTLAEKSKAALEAKKKYSKPIIVKIEKAMPFYPAEEYHQDYYKKNPIRYKFYRSRSGRDDFLKQHWPEDYK